MTWVYTQNVECPVCGANTADTDVNVHANEREWNCECLWLLLGQGSSSMRGGSSGSTRCTCRCQEDGKAAWPEVQPVESGQSNRKEFGVMPGFNAMTDGFGTEVAE